MSSCTSSRLAWNKFVSGLRWIMIAFRWDLVGGVMVHVSRWKVVVQSRSERAFSGSRLLGQRCWGKTFAVYVLDIIRSLLDEA